MRRKRENNKRAIARQTAQGARSGLKETGAVADVLWIQRKDSMLT